MTIELEERKQTEPVAENPICEFVVYLKQSIVFMKVDGISIRVISAKNKNYFKNHYSSLGYKIVEVVK